MATTRTRTRVTRAGDRRAAAPSASRSWAPLARAGIAALVLALAAWVAYSTSFAGVFVFDDQMAIVRNPNVRTLWPLTTAMSAPPENPVSVRPVASLTLALNYALAPPDVRDVMAPGAAGAETSERFLANVWGYHFLNLVLHWLAALTLFAVVRRTLATGRLGGPVAAAAWPLALVTALAWVVHPLTSDAVTYITQRTEVLMALFCLLTVYCAIRAYETSQSGDPGIRESGRQSTSAGTNSSASGLPAFRSSGRRAARVWCVAAVVTCAAGMGSKQTMAVAPLLVLAWDWLFVDPPRLRWRFYAALAATWVILIAGVLLERWPHSIGIDRAGWTPWTYLLTQTGVITHYLRLAFVPAPLVLDYDGWPMARSVFTVAPSLLLLVALGSATVIGLVRRRPWAFAGAWFFVLLAPSSSVLPLATEIAAERRVYTPLMAVVALVVVGGYVLGRAVLDRLVSAAPSRRTVGLVASTLVVGSLVIGFGWLTRERNRDYWSEERIWQDAVEKRPDNARARLNYGACLLVEGRSAEAEAQLRESLRLREPEAKAHLDLGSLLCSSGRFEEGIVHLERAMALDPDSSSAYGNLGEAYGALGRRAQAAKYFALALKADPDTPFLMNRLAWLLATSPEDDVRNGPKAVDLAERAVVLTSRRDPMSLETLAAAYAEVGRFPQAAAAEREALALVGPRADRSMAERLPIYEMGQRFRER